MVKLLMTGVLVGHRLYNSSDVYEYCTRRICYNRKIFFDKITCGLDEMK